MMKKLLLTLIALTVAAPVAAQQSFAPPQGCTGKLTVQHRNCVMVNVWTCDADPAGDQWLALIGQAGVFSVQRVDDQFQWLESYKISGTEMLQDYLRPYCHRGGDLYDAALDHVGIALGVLVSWKWWTREDPPRPGV